MVTHFSSCPGSMIIAHTLAGVTAISVDAVTTLKRCSRSDLGESQPVQKQRPWGGRQLASSRRQRLGRLPVRQRPFHGRVEGMQCHAQQLGRVVIGGQQIRAQAAHQR